MVDRNTPGVLGTEPFGAGETVRFRYRPKRGHTSSTYFTVPTQDGTVQLYRESRDGTLYPIGSAVAVTGGNEDSQQVNFPVGPVVVVEYVNTNATAGSVTCEATDGGVD